MATITNMAKIPELRRRILFTLGMIAIFRLGVGVPAPGVDRRLARSLARPSRRGMGTRAVPEAPTGICRARGLTR